MKNKDTSANKVAIVTGSATGIGYETAVHLAKNGFHTYATMRNLQKANGITEMAKTENLPLSLIQLDVTDDISVTKAIDTVINESGRIDVLVNNAGYGLVGSVEDMSIEEMKAQYETNVFGVFRVTKAVLPHMRKQHGGSIVNISSIAGRHLELPGGGRKGRGVFTEPRATDSAHRLQLGGGCGDRAKWKGACACT